MKRKELVLRNLSVLLAVGVLAMATVADASGGKKGKGGDRPMKKGEHKAVELTNVQRAPLRNITIKLSGKDASDFRHTHNCGSTLDKGKHCLVDITFQPKTPGPKSATVEVSTSGGSHTVALTGTGI